MWVWQCLLFLVVLSFCQAEPAFRVREGVLKQVEDAGTLVVNNQDGSDIHVYIYIAVTALITGVMIIGSLIALIIWSKRAWRDLKDSGAYDALRHSDS